jgi:hypothetical protein
MRISQAGKIGLLAAALCYCASAQAPAAASAATDAKGLPPRTTPAEYQAKAQVGNVTIAAEFRGHSVPAMQGTLTTEEYITVEVAFFGPEKVTVSSEDFSLRVNGKKSALSTQPFGAIMSSVKDPDYEPPVPVEKKGKGGLSSGGGGGRGEGDSGPPPPPVIPIGVQRAMAQRVQKSALPGGERTLPVAGLIFFSYRGKISGIHSLELLYAGPAGKATLNLQP